MKNHRNLLLIIIISLVLCSPIYAQKAIRPVISVVPEKLLPKSQSPKDSDSDGVSDKADQCPDTPKGVKVDTKGCPIDSDGDGFAYAYDLQNFREVVYFAEDLFNLTVQSAATLDNAIFTLKAHPEISVKIEGHTDSRGELAFKRALANSRANAVKQYLIKAGIDNKRIVSTEGFWYSKPAADNKHNRVEIIGIIAQ